MSDDKKSLLGDLTQDLGIGATVTAVITWLWADGWWQWIPAVLVGCLGVYTLLLERLLPWHGSLYKDLEQLNDGKASHPALLKTIHRAHESKCCSAQQQVAGQCGSVPSANAGHWLRTMIYANQCLDRWIGSAIWSHAVFDRLLFVAIFYPILLFFINWWLTGAGNLSPIETFPKGASNQIGITGRSIIFGLVFLPIILIKKPKWSHKNHLNNIAWIIFLLLPFYIELGILSTIGHGRIAGALTGCGASIVAAAIVYSITSNTTISSITSLSVAISIAVAGNLFGAFVGAVLGALLSTALILTIYTITVINPKIKQQKIKSLTLVHTTIIAFSISATSIPIYTNLRPFYSIELIAGAAWLFLLGWMPFINACFDWLSLGITRELLRRMTRSPAWMWGGVVLDIVVGVALTLALLWLAFQVLAFMQWCGWPVDAEAMRAAFIANPFDPQVSWLAMLAVTNLLPTIWHLGVSLWGLVDRQFTTSVSLKDSLKKLNDFMDEKGNPKPGAAAPGLGELELQTVYHSLFVHPWLYVGTVVAVVVGFWGSYVQALRWTLTWLP